MLITRTRNLKKVIIEKSKTWSILSKARIKVIDSKSQYPDQRGSLIITDIRNTKNKHYPIIGGTLIESILEVVREHEHNTIFWYIGYDDITKELQLKIY